MKVYRFFWSCTWSLIAWHHGCRWAYISQPKRPLHRSQSCTSLTVPNISGAFLFSWGVAVAVAILANQFCTLDFFGSIAAAAAGFPLLQAAAVAAGYTGLGSHESCCCCRRWSGIRYSLPKLFTGGGDSGSEMEKSSILPVWYALYQAFLCTFFLTTLTLSIVYKERNKNRTSPFQLLMTNVANLH